jgi:hypothetical protein
MVRLIGLIGLRVVDLRIAVPDLFDVLLATKDKKVQQRILELLVSQFTSDCLFENLRSRLFAFIDAKIPHLDQLVFAQPRRRELFTLLLQHSARYCARPNCCGMFIDVLINCTYTEDDDLVVDTEMFNRFWQSPPDYLLVAICKNFLRSGVWFENSDDFDTSFFVVNFGGWSRSCRWSVVKADEYATP